MLKRRTILIPPEFVTMVTISALNEISWGYLLYSIVLSLSLSLPLYFSLPSLPLRIYLPYCLCFSSKLHRETEGILTWNKRGRDRANLKIRIFQRDTSLFFNTIACLSFRFNLHVSLEFERNGY